MPTKEYTFDDLPLPELDLELNYKYDNDPGKVTGLPENCYPPETEEYIELPDGYEDAIRKHYENAAELAISYVKDHIQDLLYRDAHKQWLEEDSMMYDQYIEEDVDL